MAIIRNNLLYGNVSANDYGIYISGEGVYNAPERAVELVEVPGRNGSLTIDEGYYRNITVEYPCFTFANSQREFRRIISDFRNALLSQVGYQRIMDTYNPDEYRIGLYVEGLEVEPVYHGRAGSFTLVFNCKPQRYLISGDDDVTVTVSGTKLINPTAYESSPLIKANGYGTISFNGYSIVLNNETYGNITLFDAQTKRSTVLNRSRTYGSTLTFDRATMNTGDTFHVYGRVDVVMSIRMPTGSSDTPTFDSSAWSFTGTSDYYYTSWLTSVADQTGTFRIFFDTWSDPTLPDFVVGTAESYSDTFTIGYAVKIGSTTAESSTMSVYVDVDYDGDSTVTLTVRTTYANSPSSLTNHYVEIMTRECNADSTQSVLGTPTYIDCEIGEAYKFVNGEAVSLNRYIELGSDLPKLAQGSNSVSITAYITSVLFEPRWWKL